MSQNKIRFGIDLGTTNSSIVEIVKGEPVVIKTDSLKDTMPSCVGFNKKRSVVVGDNAKKSLQNALVKNIKGKTKGSLNYFLEFKRTMGTDKTYQTDSFGTAYSSEELSAEVLKKLKSFKNDENITSAVITVPAKFDVAQKDATARAARLAGFEQFELLQEPVAAAIAYGLKGSNKNGYWVIFDFGGGTFDAALIRAEDGILKVIDTSGDNHLGGKNQDDLIVEKAILPYLELNYSIESILTDPLKKKILIAGMKSYAESLKIQLSFENEVEIMTDLGDMPEDDDGEEMELDIKLNQSELGEILAPLHQKAIDITKNLISRNNLTNSQIGSIMLVGGPTYSPVFRQMIAEQIKEPDTSIDPMTAVATGAALYASTIDLSEEIKEKNRDQTKIQLDLHHETTSVQETEFVTISVLKEKTIGDLPDKIYAEFVRSDKAWDSGKVPINTTGEVVEVQLKEDRTNHFDIFLFDDFGNKLEAQPDSFSIISGIGGTDTMASLPHHIGVEIQKNKGIRSKPILERIEGLKKNTTLPATGVINGLKTQSDVRPGVQDDIVKIPLYQGEQDAMGHLAALSTLLYEASFTGKSLKTLLPRGSEVNLTVEVDRSGRPVQLEIYIPLVDHTEKIDIPENTAQTVHSNYLFSEIDKAKGMLYEFGDSDVMDSNEVDSIQTELNELKARLEQSPDDIDRRQETHSNLKKILLKLDKLDDDFEWPRIKQELEDNFERLESANRELGNAETTAKVEEFRQKKDRVLADPSKPQNAAHVSKEIHDYFFQLTLIYQFIGLIRQMDENFYAHHWRDEDRARQLINSGNRIISQNPSVEALRPLIGDLIKLLPLDERPGSGLLEG